MSYGLRNTLLLALSLIVIVLGSAGWVYINEYQTLLERQEKADKQKAELATLEPEAARFNEVFELQNELEAKLANYPKTLLPDNRLTQLYNYVRYADRGSVFMNFSFVDSTKHNQYGRIRFNVDGVSDYRQLRDFIFTLENAGPVVRVTTLQIRPTGNMENLNEVGFRMSAEAFYSRTDREIEFAYAKHVNGTYPRNPFYPLVHAVPSNDNNMIDAERSKLAAISDDTIFLHDQNGKLQRVRLHDRVHLGYLEHISVEKQQATFFLNKGGFVERKTLRLQK